MKKNIFKLLYIILYFSCKLKFSYLTAIIIFLFIIKLKKNRKINDYNKKKILVLNKRYGIEDIEVALETKDTNFIFYSIERKVFKVIFNSFVKYHNEIGLDYGYYRYDNELITNKKKKLQHYLFKVLKILKKIFKLDVIISFNIFYFADRELQEASVRNRIQFISLHKESLFFEGEEDYVNSIFSKNGKFKGSYILTYNEEMKKKIIENSIAAKDQVSVIGMIRADAFFAKHIGQKNTILVLLQHPQRVSKFIELAKENRYFNLNEKKLEKFHKLSLDTVSCLIELAKKRPEYNFIFKSKLVNDKFTLSQEEIIKKSKQKNCKIVSGGRSIDLINNSKVVIALNSTSIFEAICAQKKVIIPFFDIQNDEYLKKFTLDLNNNLFHANSKGELIHEIEKYLDHDNNSIELSEGKRKLLTKYIGNPDKKSSERFFNFLNRVNP